MTRRFTLTPYLFLAPALALIGVFVLWPIMAVVYFSFTEWDIVRPPVWTGLANYEQLVADPTFWKALTNSLVYLLVTPTIIALSIGLAIIVNRRLRGINIYRALYFVPAVSGSIAIGIAWRFLFDRNGFLNGLLISAGIIKIPIQWLSEPSMVLPIAMLLTIWAGIGYYSVIFVAGLQNIPEHLYDAAKVDGAGSLALFRNITLPGLRPTLLFVSVTTIIGTFRVFAQIIVMTNNSGGPFDSTRSLVMHLYQTGFQFFRMGGASAVAWVLFIIILGFTIAQFQMQRGSAD